MVRYTDWLGLLSTVDASSMQPYLSAVNKYFRDHQLPPIAVGDMLQHRLVPSDIRLPLPAPVAIDIMLAADTLRDNLTRSPATLPLIERFRACLAACENCTLFCRAKTSARCLTCDLGVDRPSQQLFWFLRKSKGDQRRDTCDKLVMAVPIPANPVLADLLDYCSTQRTAFCATYYKRPPLAAFWSLSPLEYSAEWKAASILSTWLALALCAINTSAQACFKWTSHSLRKVAASAASRIGAPLLVIKYMGS
jgi:hypothetical protein